MTFGGAAALLEGVPRRPSQDDPKRVAAWQRRRKTIGSRVRRLREERGLTLDDLALTSGLSRNTLGTLNWAIGGSYTSDCSTSHWRSACHWRIVEDVR